MECLINFLTALVGCLGAPFFDHEPLLVLPESWEFRIRWEMDKTLQSGIIQNIHNHNCEISLEELPVQIAPRIRCPMVENPNTSL